MNVKVSVVIPVYNVEKYLNKCIESVLAQTLKDIEIILVDDGSTDRCGEIIDDFAKRDKRIRVVHQKNSGYGAAVNRGIRLARGEYIGIIESDDWVEPDMYTSLYDSAVAHDADIAKGMFWKTNSTLPEEAQDTVFANPGKVNLELAPDEAFTATQWPAILAFHASIWSAIYKRDFLEKLSGADAPLIVETPDASYQDFPFAMKVLCAAKRITVVKHPFVHWRNDPGQKHSTSVTDKKAMQMIKACQLGIDTVRNSNDYNILKEALYIHVLWTNLGFLYNIDPQYEKVYWQQLRELLIPVKKDRDFKYTYFRTIDKIILSIILISSWPVAKAGLSMLKLHHKIKSSANA